MRKSNILSHLIRLIGIGLFNALYFGLGGTQHPASAWISYAFIHFAFLMLYVTPYITQRGKDGATFAQSMYAISSTYFVIELIVGGLFIIFAPEGHKFALFSQLILAAAYLVFLFSNMIADEHTAAAVEKHEAELVYVKESCAMLKPALDCISDKQLYRKVEKVFDLIQSSPVKSSSQVYNLEGQIMQDIDKLASAASAGSWDTVSSLADDLLRQANERNRLLKLANR